ncbi:putative RNA-binding protein 25, partial [Halocaridina rubra]
MAFPPRPPLMPGVPMAPMIGAPFTLPRGPITLERHPLPTLANIVTPVGIPITQAISKIPTRLPSRPPLPPHSTNNSISKGPQTTSVSHGIKPPSYSKRIESSGPAVTVFVGNITERAPDVMVRYILNTCGTVLSWKRVQGASGKLQAFGFCEFGNPDAALRAIRLLHDYEIADKKLVVKADAKTKEVLDEYKEKRKKSKQGLDSSPLQDEVEEGEDYLDEDMRVEDATAMECIANILSEHRKDIVNYVPPQSRHERVKERMSKVQEKLVALSSGADIANIPTTTNLDDMDDVEEGKKELITREITQFREQMK